MNELKAFIFLLLLAAGAITPMSADAQAAKTPILFAGCQRFEGFKMVCDSPYLTEMDIQLSRAYHRLWDQQKAAGRTPDVNADRTNLQVRVSMCRKEECVEKAMRDELVRLGETPVDRGTAAAEAQKGSGRDAEFGGSGSQRRGRTDSGSEVAVHDSGTSTPAQPVQQETFASGQFYPGSNDCIGPRSAQYIANRCAFPVNVGLISQYGPSVEKLEGYPRGSSGLIASSRDSLIACKAPLFPVRVAPMGPGQTNLACRLETTQEYGVPDRYLRKDRLYRLVGLAERSAAARGITDDNPEGGGAPRNPRR